MSDGGKENGKDSEPKTRKPAGGEDFVRAIAKIAVAQICENEGFQSFQQSALEALADVAVRYIKEIGKTANLYANLAGRSECNVLDVIQGLEDLGSIQGFPGASDIHHSLASSGVVREIRQHVSLAEEVPFAYSLPRFPVSKEPKLPPSFLTAGEEPLGEHIPVWLPAFPHPETKSTVPTCNGGVIAGDAARLQEQIKVQERGESSVMCMQQRLAANNGSEAVFGPGDSSKGKRTVDINPFLAPPLLYGEREVSSIVPPPRFIGGAGVANHVTGNMMEGFALASPIEDSQNMLSEVDERNKSMKLDGRPIVRFKLSSARKSLPAFKNVIAENEGDEELACSFGTRDDEKDEMKRRAEQILKESMENPSDPAQL
uniref:Bromodomain associated domain-containing protein n=1 Tax=Opuntia streptacantha TaxID=393608 RepID=A0A7C8YDD8_OPUST